MDLIAPMQKIKGIFVPMTGKVEVDFTKLDLKDGDVVVMQSENPPKREVVTVMHRALAETGKKVMLLVLPKDYDLKNLDEEQMYKVGWQSIL